VATVHNNISDVFTAKNLSCIRGATCKYPEDKENLLSIKIDFLIKSRNENNSQLPSVGGNVELLNDFCVAGNVWSSQSKNPSVDVDQTCSQSIEPGASNFGPSVVDGIVDVTFPAKNKQEPRLG
jgi:hypothetical protein